jgi:peptidoglycan/LPS O-acetylase OafA/YrhL
LSRQRARVAALGRIVTMETEAQQSPAAQQASVIPVAATDRAAQPARRWYYLDWLRILAILVVFFYHDADFFDYDRPPISAARLDWGMTYLTRTLELFGMPLFFVVAAFSVYFSLGSRTNQRFLSERFQRLVIPYLLAVFLAGPLVVYAERVMRGQFAGSFWQFIPHYFDGWYGFGGNFAWTGFHLWFLFQLFLFSLITLPLFRYLRRSYRVTDILRRLPIMRGEWFLIVPIALTALVEALVNLQPNSWGTRYFGGWSVATYLVGFFFCGYLLALNPLALNSFERNRMMTLALGLSALALYLVLVYGFRYSSFTVPLSILRALVAWPLIAAIMGYFKRYLDRATPWLAEMYQAVLPFYILHMPVLLGVAFVTLAWDIPVLLNFLLIAAVSLALIAGLYSIIRRFRILRVVFGMKAT